MNAILKTADDIGARTFDLFRYVQSLALLIYLSLRSAFFGFSDGHGEVKIHELRQVFSVVSSQIYFTGWQALPMAA